MKTGIALFLTAAMSTSIAAFAGEGKDKTLSDEQLSKMQKQLQLTDEQLAEMRKIRDEGGSRKEIRAVLTEEQQAKAQEMKAQREKSEKQQKGKSEKEGKGEISDEQLARMQESLDLSDAQVAEMRKIRDEGGTAKEMRAVLTEEQKTMAQTRKKERKQEKQGQKKS